MEDFVFVFCQAITGVGRAVMAQALLSMTSMPPVKHMMIVIVAGEMHVNVTVNSSVASVIK